MSKIIVGNAENIRGMRLSLENRLEYNISPENMRDNYFAEMYGIDRLKDDHDSRPFLGLIYQLTLAKRFSEIGDTVVVEKPEFGLSSAQRNIIWLSILHLAYTGRDVVIETDDKDFISLVRLVEDAKRNHSGVKSLIDLWGVKCHERIWTQIFTEILRNCQVSVANNTTENMREVLL